MQAARSRNSRRACDVRSHPFIVDDSTKVQRSPHSRVFEREISDTDISRLSESETQLHRKTFLGQRVLCQYSWVGGKVDSGLRSESGTRREAARADAFVRSLTIAPSGGFHQTTRFASGI